MNNVLTILVVLKRVRKKVIYLLYLGMLFLLCQRTKVKESNREGKLTLMSNKHVKSIQ